MPQGSMRTLIPTRGKVFKLTGIQVADGKLRWTFSHNLKAGAVSNIYLRAGGKWLPIYIVKCNQ